MTANTVMAFNKPVRIYMNVLLLGVILQYVWFLLL